MFHRTKFIFYEDSSSEETFRLQRKLPPTKKKFNEKMNLSDEDNCCKNFGIEWDRSAFCCYIVFAFFL